MPAAANRRATQRTSSAGTPVISSTYSGVYCDRFSLSSSKLSVLLVMNSSSSSPSATTTLARPSIRAASVPTFGRSQVLANGASLVCLGSTITSLAPLYLTALFTAYPTTGADTLRSAPMTSITSDCSRLSSTPVEPG